MDFAKYLETFNYDSRKEMKIQIPELLKLLKSGDVQFIDIRFKEEFDTWHFSFSKNIPLNELPARFTELDKSKLVVTACPHYDRAIMGRVFLLQQGFNARYLVDGLLGLADHLRGDNAKYLYDSLNHTV